MREGLELAPAKLNLTLAVLGRRPDGYHELESVMVPLQLADRVRVRPAEAIAVAAAYPGVPAGAENLAYRAAAALREAAGVPAGALIRIEKRIPPAAGLAGGSADAAATLRALNRLWRLDWPPEQLARVGAQVGADVPFCVWSQPALARGVGGELSPLPPLPPMQVVLAMPRVTWAGPKTRTVFQAYRPGGPQPDTAAMIAAIAAGDRARVAGAVGNALEPTVVELHPAVAELKAAMLEAGAAGAAMTGAGPTVFGLCLDPLTTLAVAEAVEERVAWMAVTALAGTIPDPDAAAPEEAP